MLWLRDSILGFDDLWSQVDFHLRVAFDVIGTPAWRMELSRQPHHELWLLRAGRCDVQIGPRRQIAAANDIVLLTANQPRLTFNPDDVPVDIIGFGFSAGLLGTVDLISLLQLPLVFPNNSPILQSLLETVAREGTNRDFGYNMAATGYAQVAVIEALRNAISVVDGADGASLEERALRHLHAGKNGDIQAVIRLIAERFRDPLDMAQMAHAAHLSPAHFSRKFKAALGIGPKEYLRGYRLRQARAMLAGSDDVVSSIARRCGFEDAAYFSRAFKNQFGLSPLEFRQSVRALSK